jgi:hypothetical protein
MKWASPQEYAELSIEQNRKSLPAFCRSHVAMSMKTLVGALRVHGDVATGRLPSLGDRVNSSAKQYLEIAHELSHDSTQLPIGRSEPFHHQKFFTSN